mgnify:CR=1 FL=1
MPMFVLGRDYNLSSVQGYSLHFKKGTPLHVPPRCVPEVVAIGGQCVDGEVDVLPPEVKEEIPLSQEERDALLREAIVELLEKNERNDFTGQGVPTAKAVARVAGTKFDVAEIHAGWRKYQAENAKTE